MRNIWQPKEIKWDIAYLKNKSIASLAFIALFFALKSNAQLPPDAWHDGFVLLNDNDTIFGNLKYNFQSNLVQVAVNNKVQTFSAQSIQMFSINDGISKRIREFYTVPYNLKGAYKTPIFFELLQEGEYLTLFAREVMVTDNMPYYGNYYYAPGGNMFRRERLDYEFYFLKNDGKIIHYNKKKRELYYIMNDKSSEVKKYLKKNKARHDRASGLVRVTAFYNQLKLGNLKE